MCDKIVESDLKMLKFVLDDFKTQEMFEKFISKISECCNLFLIATKLKQMYEKAVDYTLIH